MNQQLLEMLMTFIQELKVSTGSKDDSSNKWITYWELDLSACTTVCCWPEKSIKTSAGGENGWGNFFKRKRLNQT